MKKVLEFVNIETSKRNKIANIIISISILLCSLFLPSFFALILTEVISNKYVCMLIANLIFICIIGFIYKKDLHLEANRFNKEFKSYFEIAIKYYFLGLLLMIFFDLIISNFVSNVSLNEQTTRELLDSHTLYMLISIVLIAPLEEELVYRKTLTSIIKNKYVCAILSGVLFGGAHILTNVFSGVFVLKDLLYILPYGSMGFSFALMDKETNNTFTSIVIHAIHNLINGILILILF